MANIENEFLHVEGGRIEVWQRDDGLFGVSLLPDGDGGYSYVSSEGHDGFPAAHDRVALLAWGLERWRLNRVEGQNRG